MRYGITMFATDVSMDVVELAREAEARGLQSLWLPEHTHIPSSRRTPFPGGGDLPKEYSHTLDPFVALAAASARTETIKLCTGICLIIQRDPIILAKEVASLDLLSNGRVILGLGGGWNVEEMNHHGTEYDTRFKKLEEQVAAMKEIWTKDVAEFHGAYVNFDPIWAWPKPEQKPYPPILLGGESRYTLQRVVDSGDGWYPRGRDPEKVLAGMKDLEELATRAGRDMKTITVSAFATPPDKRVLDQFAAAGVTRAIFLLPPEPRDKVLPLLDQYAKLVK
jgi:probable F420-dependent oxidoreductase